MYTHLRYWAVGVMQYLSIGEIKRVVMCQNVVELRLLAFSMS